MINSNALLEVNTKNLIFNYNSLKKISNKSIQAATIKANAYGIGDIKTFDILYKNKCRHFFVATVEEALFIRKKRSYGKIYILNGLEDNDLEIFHRFNLIPILNSINELKLYIKKNGIIKKKIKIGVHVDTGINRLGINIKDLKLLNIKKINIEILISHLSSSEEKKNEYNKIQNIKFKKSFKYFKSIKYKSLANSFGLLLGKKFHYDLVRPGISLYGGHLFTKMKTIIKPIVCLKAKILQIKQIGKNKYIGYNQTYKTKKNTTVAILGIGYADGLFRLLSNKGCVYYKNTTFKIIGRISMDTITIDITKDKKLIKKGMYLEIINEKHGIDEIAKKCATIPHEILTSIGKRVKRIYT